jgi:hypothetical protein
MGEEGRALFSLSLSGVRYSRLRPASFGWRMGGFLWRFAENDGWGS